ncbi:MAG: hypothetical protein AAF610_00175 [Pseudomonadota bacterium]
MTQTIVQHTTEARPVTPARSLGEWLVLGCSFAAVLPIALAASLSGWRWQPWPPGRKGYQSAFREATLTARNVTAIAFSVT